MFDNDFTLMFQIEMVHMLRIVMFVYVEDSQKAFLSTIDISKVPTGLLGIMVMLKLCIRSFKEADLGFCVKITIETLYFLAACNKQQP